MALPKVDAVVIGAGAGGGVTFCRLAEAGLGVVCLERGRWHSPFEERKDDLVNQRNSSLGVAYGPDEDKNPRVFVDLDGRERVVRPRDGSYQPNAACVGGGTFSYGAQAWRYMPQDFRMRTTYGAIEGSTLEDWPISYDDMEPYYEMAEYQIGVSGDVEPNVVQGPAEEAAADAADVAAPARVGTLDPAAKRLGLHPFHIRCSSTPSRYNGRSACMRIRWCVGFGCETNAKNGTHNTVIPRALATGNANCGPSAWSKEVLLDDRGRARGVALLRRERPAAGAAGGRRGRRGCATESARLLLLSKSRLHPNGPRQPPRLGGPQPEGPHVHRRGRFLRAGRLRRRRPRRLHRDLRLQPRHAGPRRRRDARERVHPPADPVRERPAAGRADVGQGPQGLHAEVLPAERDDPGSDAGPPDVGRPRAARPEE